MMDSPSPVHLMPTPAHQQFKRDAIPALRQVIAWHAGRIARERETVDVAVRATCRIADHLGAEEFSSPWRLHLVEWIQREVQRKAETERARLLTEARL